jgi:DNA modification methylase
MPAVVEIECGTTARIHKWPWDFDSTEVLAKDSGVTRDIRSETAAARIRVFASQHRKLRSTCLTASVVYRLACVNLLYYGDNLDVLRRHVKDETIDLVYLDPPFKSNQDYNVLFAEKDGSGAASQFKAFEDTWEWNQASAAAYQEIVESGGHVSEVMQAFRKFLGTNDMLAYLTMMTPRLVELRRVLKHSGSIYLHCDPTASHYLKLLLDSIFGPINFRNEIVWKRSHAHSDSKQGATHFGRVTDSILFYAKSEDNKWNPQFLPYDKEYVERDYRRIDPDGRRYRIDNLQGPGGAAKGNPFYEVMGVERFWRYSKENMDKLIREGRVVQTRPGAVPQYKRYLDEMPGVALQSIWADLPIINNRSKEALGYPTQKPESLLERIIKASSDESDIVLDPFCGCGTAIAVAQKVKRSWIGIDITHLAIGLIKSRLRDSFGDEIVKSYKVIGEPVSVQDAAELAKEDAYQFQWWALGLVGARRTEEKNGADKGIDGRLFFHDEENGKTKQIILSVKSGHLTAPYVRDLRGVIEREQAELGVLIALEEPTKPMLAEAAAAGFFKSPWGNHPRLQILTIAELLDGKRIDYPPTINVTHKRAPRAETPMAAQLSLTPAEDEPPANRARRKR